MTSPSFSAFPLPSGHTGFLEGSDVFWCGNKWARLYLLNLRLNICFDKVSSRGSSNSNTCNIFSSRTVLIWVGAVTCEAFSLTEMIWLCLYSSWITVDDYNIQKPRETRKVIHKIQFSLISWKELFISMQPQALSVKQVISACRPLSSIISL